jgi:hypothetical protein
MIARILVSTFFISVLASVSCAADIESRLNGLEEVLKKQQEMIEEQQRFINQLKEELSAIRQQPPEKDEHTIVQGAKPEPAVAAEQPPKPSGLSGLFGGSVMTNPYISLVLNSFFYSSSINERKLDGRGMPGYSTLGFEQRKGFNISEGELFLFSPVDPYFNLYANIPFTENGVSLEEAYFVTTALPEGFQLKGGKFKSNISRLNAQHPHAWDFVDAPLVYRGFLGKEGLIEKGVQFTYLPSLPFYTQLGVEVLQGENEVMFNGNATGGPHALSGFVKSSFDFAESSTILFGPYVVSGRTRTNTVANDTLFSGNSVLYGFETVYKWKPSALKSFILQGEYVVRRQSGELTSATLGAEDRLTRSQDGMYVQGLYQMGRWRIGARYDRLAIFKDDYRLAGAEQGFGSNLWRGTGALEFNPTEFSRLRLQYNYDRSGMDAVTGLMDGRTNHEVYLQLILGIGAHAAHAF